MTCLLVALFLGLDSPPPAAATRTGADKIEVNLGGRLIEVFTYKPKVFKKDGPMLVVFHGMLRNADEYRDNARGLADRFGMLVVAPRFDRERFPDASYQRGGLLDENGRLTPSERWTWGYIPKLIAEVRHREGAPEMPVYLIGHSAGAQFAERLAAFAPADVQNIVVANAGVHLFPSRDRPFSFGFGDLPPEVSDDEHLRRYLRQPVTIYLGTADTRRDDSLFLGEDADRQGRTRLERGRNAYRFAEDLARRNGWEFRWRLVEVAGVGHDGEAMFDHPKAEEALFRP
jgi:pimeloyl-ACP methyl ester carboxylesterase